MSIPKLDEQPFGHAKYFICNISRLQKRLLMGFILEIICAYRDADAVSPHTVRTYAGGNTVCQRQQDAVCLFFGSNIPGERCGVAVPLSLSRLGKYWCLVNAVCVCMQLLAQFFSNQSLHKGNICMCQAADGENPTFLQPLCRGAPDGKKRPDRQRPELLGDFLQKQGVDFVRLFKVTCHFGQKLVGTNADVNRKAQRITDFIFDSAGEKYQVDDVKIETLRSTDAGVAFYVETRGATFFHAGDLNDWTWEGAGDLINGRMRREYRTQIKKLAGKPINLAFVPMDPRQGADQELGMDYFLETTSAEYVFPMHMWQDYSHIPVYKNKIWNPGMAERVVEITHENQVFLIEEK